MTDSGRASADRKWAAENRAAREAASRSMLTALRDWKCMACGGTGTYHQNAKDTARKAARGAATDPHYNPPPVPCRACLGQGLHPKAKAAIDKAEAAGIRPLFIRDEQGTPRKLGRVPS